jgi:tetratricopeptide (TPR) repeat protein
VSPTESSSSERGTRARAARAGGTTGAGAAPARAKRQTAPSTKAKAQPGQSKAKAQPSAAKPKRETARIDPDRLAALEEERDFLLRSLRDLEAEHEAGDIDDHDYTALEDDYTARAAAVLRAIEGQRAELASAPRRSTRYRVTVGVVIALLAVGAGVLVAQWSGSRGAGDTITGGARADTRQQLLDARQAAASGQFQEAAKDYQKVIEEDPANLEALAFNGWMLHLLAQQQPGSSQRSVLQQAAQKSLQAALATDPHDPTSLVFMAAVLDDQGQPRAALADLNQVPTASIPDVVRPLVTQLRTHLQSELATH